MQQNQIRSRDCVPMSADRSRPAGHGSTLVIFALSLGGFAIGTVEFAAMSLVPYFASDLGVNAATASYAISIYALGVVIGAPTIAVLGARLSRRTLLISLMALYSLANLMTAISTSYHLLLFFRFLAGLPHGAYFGVAALMAASLVPPGRRAKAISMVMLGLTLATLVGVPMSSFIAQYLTWRLAFGIAAALAAVTALMIFLHAPADRPQPGANPLNELSALCNRQVLLTLGIGAVGFGGIFSVYTYVANTLQEITHAPHWGEPFIFMVFGSGMVLGTIVTGRIADRGLLQTTGGLLILAMIMLLLYPLTVHNIWLMAGCVFLIGFSGAMGLPLQTHLMDVSGRAQTMAAAMHHAAFNFANAVGPWLASLIISSGWSYPASGYVGAFLAAGGITILCVTRWDLRRQPGIVKT